MKYKIKFTIQAETLFSILAKMLPIEDLSMEELFESSSLGPSLRVGKPTRKLEKPKLKQVRSKPAIPFNLKAGINRIILETLEKGPSTPTQIKENMAKTGYSPNSVGSRLQSLEAKNIVTRVGNGSWRLVSLVSEVSDKQSLSETKESANAPA